VFDRAVQKVLAQQGWQIVRLPSRARRARTQDLELAA